MLDDTRATTREQWETGLMEVPTLEIEGIATIQDGRFSVDPGLILDPELLEFMQDNFDGKRVRVTLQVIPELR